MRTAEFFEKVGTLDSAVWCTPWSSKMSVFSCFRTCYVFRLSFLRKTSEVKKIPWPICDLQYQFHFNIFRHHREIAFVKLCIKTDLDKLLTLRCASHRGVWLPSGMHTAEFLKNCSSLDSMVRCTPRSLTPCWDAQRGVWLRGGHDILKTSGHLLKVLKGTIKTNPFWMKNIEDDYSNCI